MLGSKELTASTTQTAASTKTLSGFRETRKQRQRRVVIAENEVFRGSIQNSDGDFLTKTIFTPVRSIRNRKDRTIKTLLPIGTADQSEEVHDALSSLLARLASNRNAEVFCNLCSVRIIASFDRFYSGKTDANELQRELSSGLPKIG